MSSTPFWTASPVDQGEGFGMLFTMEDFQRQYAKEHFKKLTSAECRKALESLAPGRGRRRRSTGCS
jgi:hypothetical protein